MGNVRGLRTRPCPKCNRITHHRTLYARSTTKGNRRWLQLFWACTRCESLNHIVLPSYRLERASSPLPSALAISVVTALEDGPLDFDGLIMSLRRAHAAGIRHIFNSEVKLAVEFLKGRGVIAEENKDCTEKVLESLKVQSAQSRHLSVCPAESKPGSSQRSLVSLYAQRQEGTANGMKLVSVGAFCLRCQYHQIDL